MSACTECHGMAGEKYDDHTSNDCPRLKATPTPQLAEFRDEELGRLLEELWKIAIDSASARSFEDKLKSYVVQVTERSRREGYETGQKARVILTVSRDDCWLAAGYKDKNGYGRMNADGRTRMTHVVMYEAFKGAVPEGLYVDHLCEVPTCINPDHLEAVTPGQNTRRHYARLFGEYCSNGHKRSENTYLYTRPGGGVERKCRACHAKQKRDARARRRLLRLRTLTTLDKEKT